MCKYACTLYSYDASLDLQNGILMHTCHVDRPMSSKCVRLNICILANIQQLWFSNWLLRMYVDQLGFVTIDTFGNTQFLNIQKRKKKETRKNLASFEWLCISFRFHRINCVRHGYSCATEFDVKYVFHIAKDVVASYKIGRQERNTDRVFEISKSCANVNKWHRNLAFAHTFRPKAFMWDETKHCGDQNVGRILIARTQITTTMMMMICARRNIYTKDNNDTIRWNIYFVHFETWKLRVYFLFSGCGHFDLQNLSSRFRFRCRSLACVLKPHSKRLLLWKMYK